ncbi:MAG TPA: hypothetical protein VFV93_00185 [Thermomicrobiales bacterium]|nr:hypothetical protein [Thermomicrobiales bacterium]
MTDLLTTAPALVTGRCGLVNVGSGRLTIFLEVARHFATLTDHTPEIPALVDKPVGVQARFADTGRLTRPLDRTPAILLGDGFGRVLRAAEERASVAQRVTVA